MKVTQKGSGEPEIAVVYCTHGDETAGKKAVEKVLEKEPDFQKGVKFVLANEKAFKQGKRFIDTDLNRSFPGNSESEKYEERLADRLMQELKDLKVLDLHETSTSPTPFSLFTWMDEEIAELLRYTRVDRAVEISYTPGCGINNYGGIEVETGPKGSEKSVDQCFRILENFLINTGAIEGERKISKPELYSVYSTEERPEGEWTVNVENFRPFEEGESIAVSNQGKKITAEKSFIPILFTESYPHIFGFKAVRLEKVEERIFQ